MNSQKRPQTLPRRVEKLQTLTEVPDVPAVALNGTFRNSLLDMRNEPFLRSRKHADQHFRANYSGAHPDIIEFARAFHRRMKRLGVPVFVHSCVRTHSEQLALLKRGVTKAKPGKSPHNVGMAVDIVHSTRAWNLTEKQWEIWGHVAKEIRLSSGRKIVWGGDWSFYDPAHFELEGFRDLRSEFPFEGLHGTRVPGK